MTDKFFTVVFRGDIRDLAFNPMKAETIFGAVEAVSDGDALEKAEDEEDFDYIPQGELTSFPCEIWRKINQS